MHPSPKYLLFILLVVLVFAGCMKKEEPHIYQIQMSECPKSSNFIYPKDSIVFNTFKFKSEEIDKYRIFIVGHKFTYQYGGFHYVDFEITDKVKKTGQFDFECTIADTLLANRPIEIVYNFFYAPKTSVSRHGLCYFSRNYFYDSDTLKVKRYTNDTFYNDYNFPGFSLYLHSNSHFHVTWTGGGDIVYDDNSIYSGIDSELNKRLYFRGYDTIGVGRHTFFKKLSLSVATFNAITDDKMILDSTQNGVIATKVKNFQKDDMIAFITEEKHKGIIHIKNTYPVTFDYIIKK